MSNTEQEQEEKYGDDDGYEADKEELTSNLLSIIERLSGNVKSLLNDKCRKRAKALKKEVKEIKEKAKEREKKLMSEWKYYEGH